MHLHPARPGRRPLRLREVLGAVEPGPVGAVRPPLRHVHAGRAQPGEPRQRGRRHRLQGRHEEVQEDRPQARQVSESGGGKRTTDRGGPISREMIGRPQKYSRMQVLLTHLICVFLFFVLFFGQK